MLADARRINGKPNRMSQSDYTQLMGPVENAATLAV
jgi:hypothetical protein